MKKTQETMFLVEISRKRFKSDYSLRGRIGIYIGVFIGLITLKFED